MCMFRQMIGCLTCIECKKKAHSTVLKRAASRKQKTCKHSEAAACLLQTPAEQQLHGAYPSRIDPHSFQGAPAPAQSCCRCQVHTILSASLEVRPADCTEDVWHMLTWHCCHEPCPLHAPRYTITSSMPVAGTHAERWTPVLCLSLPAASSALCL